MLQLDVVGLLRRAAAFAVKRRNINCREYIAKRRLPPMKAIDVKAMAPVPAEAARVWAA